MKSKKQVKYYEPIPGNNELIGGPHPEPLGDYSILYSDIKIHTNNNLNYERDI